MDRKLQIESQKQLYEPNGRKLIKELKSCADDELLKCLSQIKWTSIKSWFYELSEWADVLTRFNAILDSACKRSNVSEYSTSPRQLAIDLPENGELNKLVLAVLKFTAMIIENSGSLHFYNSFNHLTTLLESTDVFVVSSVIDLLYLFGKRCTFEGKFQQEFHQCLLRLFYFAESWGGKENLDLVSCCSNQDVSNCSSATAVKLAYNFETSSYVQLDNHDHQIDKNPAVTMDNVMLKHLGMSEEECVQLYARIRVANWLSDFDKRKPIVMARLKSLLILFSSNLSQIDPEQLLQDGLINELIDVLKLDDSPSLSDIKVVSLKAITVIMNKTQQLKELIVEAIKVNEYNGLLPTLVRKYVDHLIKKEKFSHQFALSLFELIYHLAEYSSQEIVSSGIMEDLLKVVDHKQEFVMYVTGAVILIGRINNSNMSSVKEHDVINVLNSRLAYEIDECLKELNPSTQTGFASATTNSKSALCYPQRANLIEKIFNFFIKSESEFSYSKFSEQTENSFSEKVKLVLNNEIYFGKPLYQLAFDVLSKFHSHFMANNRGKIIDFEIDSYRFRGHKRIVIYSNYSEEHISRLILKNASARSDDQLSVYTPHPQNAAILPTYTSLSEYCVKYIAVVRPKSSNEENPIAAGPSFLCSEESQNQIGQV